MIDRDTPQPAIRRRPDPRSAATSSPCASPTYDVGYKKPPAQTRFKPGQSGNPKGRPKGARSLNTMVRELMQQKIKIRTSRGIRSMTRAEALLLKSLELATKGDGRALERCLRLYRDAMPEEPAAPLATDSDDLTATDEAILARYLESAVRSARQEGAS